MRQLCGHSLLFCLLFGPFATPNAASTFVDFSARLTYQDNQSNAEPSFSVEEGFIAQTRAALTHRILLSPRWGVQLGAHLEADGNERFGDLSRAGAGAEVSIHYKPAVGYTAPWFSLKGSATLSEFNGSALRDGAAGLVQLTAGRRLTETLTGRAGYVFDWRRAFNGRAFDTLGHGGFASVGYRAGAGWRLYARYDIRVGDVTSTSAAYNKIIASADAIEADDAFGVSSISTAGFIGPGPTPGQPALGPLGGFQRFAYRLDAVSHSGRVGANYALSDTMSLDFSARHRTTEGDGNNDYRLTSFEAAILYRFF